MGADYLGLLAGYGAAMAAFWAVFIGLKPAFLRNEQVAIERPWIELGVLAIGVAGVIGVGQLYVRRLLLPEEGELFQSLNQIAIFAPAVVVLVLQGSFWRKNFLPLRGAVGGLVLGLVLAVTAFTAFIIARHGIGAWPAMGQQIVNPGNISIAVQVALEDLLIAALASRLMAATGWRVAIVVAAALFAAAHIPAMLAEGEHLADLGSLLLDTGLGVMVIGAILASRSIWWFWPVHAVMDLTQFLRP